MKTTTVSCDVCGDTKHTKTEICLDVIFTTEQTEGRGSAPYLSNQKMDICPTCLSRILEGNYLFAHGAQGHNTYYFKDNEK